MIRCPLCRAKYRGENTCHRCQTDLSILLTIEADAAKWAAIAVQRLAAGNLNRAKYYAGKAKKQHATKFHIILEDFIISQLGQPPRQMIPSRIPSKLNSGVSRIN